LQHHLDPLRTHPGLPPTPRVHAVDDWAWRRGRRYGTFLVDLERNAVVGLLPDRHAETLAEWLRQHPGIEPLVEFAANIRRDFAAVQAALDLP